MYIVISEAPLLLIVQDERPKEAKKIRSCNVICKFNNSSNFVLERPKLDSLTMHLFPFNFPRYLHFR